MAYTTIEDLKNVISERELALLTDDTVSNEKVDSIIQSAIDYASSRVDSKLIFRYNVPLKNPPAVIVSVVQVIAKRHLFNRRGLWSKEDELEYKDILQWLDDIVEGKARVPEMEGEPEPDFTAETGLANTDSAAFDGQVFV